MGDKITALPAATSLDGTEVSPIVQAGTTKKVSGTLLRTPIGNAGGDLVGSYPSPTLAAVTTAQSGVGSVSAIPVLSIDSKGRVTSLSSVPNRMGTVTSVTAGTGLSGGPITAAGSLSVVYGATAGTAAQGNDSRFNTIPAASATLPLPDGAATVGTGTTFARADHIHPQGTVTLSGDVSGSGSSSITATLANITSSQSNVGSLTQIPRISIDAKGRVINLTTVANPQTALTGLVGDVLALGPGTVSAELSASGVTAGSYGYASTGKVATFTVDAKGRIGSASEAVIVLPTDKTSSNSLNTILNLKTVFFTNVNDSVPYKINQWITLHASNNVWMSGYVTACSTVSVTFQALQASSISATNISGWTIRLGQTINYSGVATNGQLLQYNSGQWSPSTVAIGDATSLRGFPIGSGYTPNYGDGLVWAGTEWRPQPGGSSNATSIQGFGVSGVAPSAGDGLVYNGLIWQPAFPNANAVKIQGRDLSDQLPDNNMCLTWVASLSQWQPSFPQEANANKLQSRDVANTLPTANQVLGWDDVNSIWKPIDAAAGGSDATSLQGDAIADATPSALDVLTWAQVSTGGGDYEWRPRPLGGNTAPTAGQGLVYDATNGWVAGDVNASKIQNITVSQTAPADTEVLKYNASLPGWAPAPESTNATTLQNQPISATAPSTGNLLRFDGTSWSPFDGFAFPNWNTSNYYNIGDKVAHDGKIWVSTTSGTSNTPSTGSSYWAENIGSNSGNPSNQSTPAYWLRVTTPAGDGYLPIYV